MTVRITLSISDELLTAAMQRARAGGVSLDEFVEAALRVEVGIAGSEVPEIPIFHGGAGVRPGIDLTSNRSLLEALDEGCDPDSLR